MAEIKTEVKVKYTLVLDNRELSHLKMILRKEIDKAGPNTLNLPMSQKLHEVLERGTALAAV